MLPEEVLHRVQPRKIRDFPSVTHLVIVCSLLLGSCATPHSPQPPPDQPPLSALPLVPALPAPPPPPPAIPARSYPWKTVAPGITLLERFDFSADVGRPLTGSVAKIDLTAPGIEIVTTPGNGTRPGETDGLRTTTFLKKTGCILAINAAPYSPIHFFEGQAQEIAGLHIASGETISPANSYPTLSFRPGTATIGSASSATGSAHAVAGFKIILKNGQPRGGTTTLHPRTAAGVSTNGQTLYLLVLDGRQPGKSEGATESETGEILKGLGAGDAINLDGGGTTAMALKTGSGARLLNTPINGGIPGLERVAASHLGVRLQ